MKSPVNTTMVPLLVSALLVLWTGYSPDTSSGDAGGDGPSNVGNDEDGDCISDTEEGRFDATDTDRDGTPDYLDDDSDDDGISDADESVNHDCDLSIAVADGDADGIPNFRDLDSDGNLIVDRDEDINDLDGDGIPNFADTDDDGDQMPDTEEIGQDITDMPDSDLDGMPDYHDVDSDNDSILDFHERGADTDQDGLPDYQDSDSDNDGIEDRDEAGDNNPETYPFDTDEDGQQDYRDTDSDNDGLTDAWEWDHRDTIGTSPYNADTDEDEVIDWIEVAAGTDPTNGADSPLTRGHFVFIVPFEEPPEPPNDTLAFSTSLQLGDVFFTLDLSASMDGELSSIRSEMTEIIEAITCGPGESPEFTSCIPDLWTGFGWFTDASGSGDGYAALEVNANLTSDVEYVIEQIPTSTTSGSEEAQRKAAFCTVHGPGDPWCPDDMTRNLDEWPCPGAGIGFPCFRPDAARMLVMITDEDMHEDPLPDFDIVAEELMSAQITFIGINAEEYRDAEVSRDLEEIAVRTGSFDEFGGPLVFMGADDEVSDTVADAIRAAARVPLDVTARPVGTIQEGINPMDFIEYLSANLEGEAPCTAWETVTDTNGDGRDDTFIQIDPGTPVCWDIGVIENNFVPPIEVPQVFTATIEVRGGSGGTLLDSRDVYFLVPPESYIPPPE